MLQYFVIILVVASKCDSRCTGYQYGRCDSLDAVEKAGDQKQWTEIVIKSFGLKEKIYPKVFGKTPNVNLLVFNNSVNDIEDFAFAGLASLGSIYFSRCDLPVIKRNWLTNSNLYWIRAEYSNIKTFEARCFDECQSLSYFNFEGNNISRVVGNVFSSTAIRYLYLNENRIHSIEEKAFANMSRLQTLSLEGNFLTSFNSKLFVGTKILSVTLLLLSNNQIKSINKDTFVAFPNLSHISLSSNGLESIQEETFNELSKIIFLGLSSNKLKSFSETALPYNGLPSLETLYLSDNLLNYWPRSFIHNFPNLSEISIFGNPWQCGCYKQIRNSIYYNNIKILRSDEYLNGEKPVCVVSDTNRNECIENVPNVKELHQIYVNH